MVRNQAANAGGLIYNNSRQQLHIVRPLDNCPTDSLKIHIISPDSITLQIISSIDTVLKCYSRGFFIVNTFVYVPRRFSPSWKTPRPPPPLFLQIHLRTVVRTPRGKAFEEKQSLFHGAREEEFLERISRSEREKSERERGHEGERKGRTVRSSRNTIHRRLAVKTGWKMEETMENSGHSNRSTIGDDVRVCFGNSRMLGGPGVDRFHYERRFLSVSLSLSLSLSLSRDWRVQGASCISAKHFVCARTRAPFFGASSHSWKPTERGERQ